MLRGAVLRWLNADRFTYRDDDDVISDFLEDVDRGWIRVYELESLARGEAPTHGHESPDVQPTPPSKTDPAARTAAQRQLVDELAAAKRQKLLERNEELREQGRLDDVLTDAQIEARVASYVESKDLGFDYEAIWGPALHPSSRVVSCPGRLFGWAYLAKRGVVPDPQDIEIPVDMEQAYSGIFKRVSKLLEKDNDTESTWGGKNHTAVSGDPILELHEDLRSIGYPIPLGT